MLIFQGAKLDNFDFLLSLKKGFFFFFLKKTLISKNRRYRPQHETLKNAKKKKKVLNFVKCLGSLVNNEQINF